MAKNERSSEPTPIIRFDFSKNKAPDAATPGEETSN